LILSTVSAKDATSQASFAEAAYIGVTLYMHEEASYEGLDPSTSVAVKSACIRHLDVGDILNVLGGQMGLDEASAAIR